MSAAMKSGERAVVVVRSGSGGGMWVWPTRVYLLMVDLDSKGRPMIPVNATRAKRWVRVSENKRATRRMRNLVEQFESFAKAVNDGKMTFDEASDLLVA